MLGEVEAILTVIDTDPGIDDALALLLAWGSPGVRVDALTAVAGNVPLADAIRNALRLVELRRPEPAPRIAAGAAQPLVRPLWTAVKYHGADGLGDLPDWPPVDLDVVPHDAIPVLLDAARRDGPGLTLIALGPLTNVALALRVDREVMRRIRRVVAMGGAVDVPGNVTEAAEFNIYVDPEAAREVFDAGLALDLVPLDATRQATITRAELEDGLRRTPGPLADRIAAFTARGFRVDAGRGSPGMVQHDPLAVGVAIDPTLVEWEPVRLTVGDGGETRRASGAPNCRIARTVDLPRFRAMLLELLCPAGPGAA
jgi:purine nucleosidase/pyrimidine-specific ribonucleoside hydrolase